MSKLSVVAIVVVLALSGAAYANILLNPGFESQLTSWTTFGSGIAAETWASRSGSYGCAFYGWVADGGGIYQDVAVGSISSYTFSVYGFQDSTWPSRTVEMKLEFFDSSFTLLGSTSQQVVASASWQQFTIAGVNPNNTAYVRPVLATSGGATAGGAFKWDDASLTSSALPIPEPASVTLLGLGFLVLHRVWRRNRI